MRRRNVFTYLFTVTGLTVLAAGCVVAPSVVVPGAEPPPSEPRPVGNPSGVGDLVFSDHFDTLDASNWTRQWFDVNNGYSRAVNIEEDGCYHRNQATVSGGLLHLRTAPTSSPRCRRRDGSVTDVKSGIVSSNGLREFRYGYFEARIHMDSAANWPAWWTNGHHTTWPDRGELDMMELLSCRRPAWHAHSLSIEAGGCENQSIVGWHTYAMRWRPSRVDFFYDGTKVGGTSGSIPHDHYLVLNQAVRSDYSNGMETGVDMQVDYVRVWDLP